MENQNNTQKNNYFMGKIFPVLMAFLLLVFGFFAGWTFKDIFAPHEEKFAKWAARTIADNFYGYNDLTKAQKEDLLATLDFYRITGDRYSGLWNQDTVKQKLDEAEGKVYGVGFYRYPDLADVFNTPENPNDDMFVIETVFNGLYYDEIHRFDAICGLNYELDGKKIVYDFYDKDGNLSINPTDNKKYTYNDILTAISAVPQKVPFELWFNRPVDIGEEIAQYRDNIIKVNVKKDEFEPTFVHYFDSDNEMYETVLDEDTAVVEFTSFMTPAADQFAAAMKKFKDYGKKNLILDLRYNGGGSVTILSQVASYLVNDADNSKRVLLGTQKFANGRIQKFYSFDNKYIGMNFEKIIVLANRDSASASEALMVAMKDYGTMTAHVGTETYGKAIMQVSYFFEPLKLPNTSALYLTTAKLFMPLSKDVSIHGVGLIPESRFSVEENIYSQRKYDGQLRVANDFIGA